MCYQEPLMVHVSQKSFVSQMLGWYGIFSHFSVQGEWSFSWQMLVNVHPKPMEHEGLRRYRSACAEVKQNGTEVLVEKSFESQSPQSRRGKKLGRQGVVVHVVHG